MESMSEQANRISGAPGIGAGRPRMPRWVKVFVAIGIVLAVLLLLMLTGVLGEGHSPRRHFGGAQTSNDPGTRADADAATRTLEVTALDTLVFEPATIRVGAGETVTFVVTNAGKSVHEFTLGDAAMQREHAQAMAHIPAGMAHEFPNAITLQPGETKRLTWRFADAGRLEFACHVKGHYQGGMRGPITVS
jgi:uncharacterized cupredoxin-like copper-binding protein